MDSSPLPSALRTASSNYNTAVFNGQCAVFFFGSDLSSEQVQFSNAAHLDLPHPNIISLNRLMCPFSSQSITDYLTRIFFNLFLFDWLWRASLSKCCRSLVARPRFKAARSARWLSIRVRTNVQYTLLIGGTLQWMLYQPTVAMVDAEHLERPSVPTNDLWNHEAVPRIRMVNELNNWP